MITDAIDALGVKRAQNSPFTRKPTTERARLALEAIKTNSIPVIRVRPKKYQSLMGIGDRAQDNLDDSGK